MCRPINWEELDVTAARVGHPGPLHRKRYCDDAFRLAVHRAVAVETSRGWKLAKAKASHRIDVVVALAMAALGAVEGGQLVGEGVVAAVGLSHAAVRVSIGGTESDLSAGYEAEFRERARVEFDVGLLDDGPAYGSRRSWRDES